MAVPSKTARSPGDPDDLGLFQGVRYYIHESVPLGKAADLRNDILDPASAIEATPPRVASPSDERPPDSNGTAPSPAPAHGTKVVKTHFDLATTTHIITDTLNIAEYRIWGAWLDDEGSVLKVPMRYLGDAEEGNSDVDRLIYLVTPLWVTKSFDLQKLQAPRYYSPDPAKFFSGVVVATEGLMDGDAELIESGMAAWGGQFRSALTKECTHLVCATVRRVVETEEGPVYEAAGGPMYETALQNQSRFPIRVVLPHWFHCSVAQRNFAFEKPFLYPDPPLLKTNTYPEPEFSFLSQPGARLRYRGAETYPVSEVGQDDASHTSRILGPDPLRRLKNEGQEAYLKMAETDVTKFIEGNSKHSKSALGSTTAISASNVADSMSTSRSNETTVKQGKRGSNDTMTPSAPVFRDRRIYLAGTLALSPTARNALRERIILAGGECRFGPRSCTLSLVDENDDTSMNIDSRQPNASLSEAVAAEQALLDSDYVVVDYREGWEYWLARTNSLTIGSLQWLVGVLDSDRVRAPTDRLLDFPTPKEPAYAGFGEQKGSEEGRGRGGKGWMAEEVTVTNYNGPTRSYLIKMIERLGGRYSGGLDVARTTLLVAANKAGAKAAAAARREVQIVNHLYVEDCFSSWALLPILREHIDFPRGLNHLDAVGEKGLTSSALERWENLPEVRRRREADLKELPSVKEQGRREAETRRVITMQADALANHTTEEAADLTGLQDISPVKQQQPRHGHGEASEADMSMAIVVDAEVSGAIDQALPQAGPSSRPYRKSELLPPPTANSVTVDMDLVDEEQDDESSDTENDDGQPGPSAMQVEEQLIPGKSSQSQQVEEDTSLSAKAKGKQREIPPKEFDTSSAGLRSPIPPKAVSSTKSKAAAPLKAQTSESDVVRVAPRRSSTEKMPPQPASGLANDIVEEEEVVIVKKAAPISKSKKATDARKARRASGSVMDMDMDDEAIAEVEKPAARASRKAAVAASRRVATAAEDMNVFAKEKKRKRPSIDREDILSIGDSSEGRGSKKAKGKPPASEVSSRPAKARAASLDSLPEIDEFMSTAAPPKKGKAGKMVVDKGVVPTKLKNKRVQEHIEQAKTTPQVASFDAPPGASKSEQPAQSAVVAAGAQVVILQSGHRLSDKLVKVLERLGARFTEDPKEHTHLCTDKVSRTEKFLLSVIKGVYIVRPQWAENSAKMGTLLDESKYPLNDSKAEKSRGFSLIKSLDRAKNQPLLEGRTFYLSPKLVPAASIIQSVIEAAGGTAQIRCPLVKELRSSPNKHVISSVDEKRWWLPLTRMDEDEEPIPIYTPELIIEGIIRQELDFGEQNRINLQEA